MKELFQKLSNLFTFGKEARLANQEAPDMSGPDDSNIDPMKVPLGQEAPDMSGPELAGEHTIEEQSKLAPEFKKREAAEKVARAETGVRKLEEKREPKKPELSEKEKRILDFEETGGGRRTEEQATIARAEKKKEKAKPTRSEKESLPKQAEYMRVEKDEATKGKEVSREVITKHFNYLRSVLSDFKPDDLKTATDILFGRGHEQMQMGTSPEDTMKYVNVLQESGELKPLVETALDLYKNGNQEDVDSFAFWVDKYIRDRTRTKEAAEKLSPDYIGIEKDAIKKEVQNLIADFSGRPMEAEEPVYVAEKENRKPVSDAFVKEWTGGYEDDKEWGPEEDEAEKTEVAGTPTRRPGQ